MTVRRASRTSGSVRHRHSAGYTLWEMMVAFALLASVAAIAIPSFSNTLRNNRIVTHNNELVSALTLARSEAVKRGVRVTACRSADQATCATTGGWEQGFIVFVDPANFGTVDTGEAIIRVWQAFQGGTTVRTGANYDDWVSFVGSGEVRAAPANADSFRVCGKTADTSESRTVTVGLIGYARTEKGSASCP